MLYQFLLNFVDNFGFLNVFKYLTFRTGLSFFTSLVIVLFIGGPFIKFFSNQKIFNPIRNDGPEDHIVKKIGTPTMGGIIILLGLIISVILWADLSNNNIFSVNNIELTKKNFNSNQKLADQAITKGFNQLIEKILLKKDIVKLKSLTFEDIKELVLYYQIIDKEDVKSKNEYINFTSSIRFNVL